MRLLSYISGLPVVVFCLFGAVSSGFAQTPAQNGAAMAKALEAADNYEWARATELARANSDPIAGEIVEWLRLRAGDGTLGEYEAFIAANSDWPGMPFLQKTGEAAIPVGQPSARIIQYFQNHPPQTGEGAVFLALAYQGLAQHDEAAAVAVRAWREFTLSDEEQSALWRFYSGALTPYNVERLDKLLWESRLTEATRMLDIVPAKERALARVRMALQGNQNGVNGMIAALPASMKGNAGLAYDRFRWRLKRDLWDGAHEMLVERSTSREALGRPEFWSNKRRTYARRAMRKGDNQVAYLLASQHFLKPEEKGYSDLEWLAGFLALRKLNDPERAVQHFENFLTSIKSPISVGRAGYWLGRSYEAMGNAEFAKTSYGLGATYQTSFYGQLAAERGGFPADGGIAGAAKADWTKQAFLQSDTVRAALLLHFAGRDGLTRRFLSHASESEGLTGRAALGQLAMDINLPNTALKIAKLAAKSGDVIQNAYYPLTALAGISSPVPAELTMSIARQESELFAEAQSPVGALGLMQVMPATAKVVAEGLGIPYSKDRLGSDWEYNAKIGTAYLADMLERYNGNYILAAAAYNAGPHRADRWIKDYGDPRNPNVDAIDWIETIPFRETRNYVMRVTEALFIYRARIAGKVPAMGLTAELKRGG